MSGQASFIAPTSVLRPIASTAATTAIASSSPSSRDPQQPAYRNRTFTSNSTNEQDSRIGIDRSRNNSFQFQSTQPLASNSTSAPATALETSRYSSNSKGAHASALPSSSTSDDYHSLGPSSSLADDRENEHQQRVSSDPQNASSSSGAAWSHWTERLQDHLRAFFSMHHKLFDLVAFYVVMFAINGQMTSLPTRLEWIGFCVQSIVALRRAFQTSIKHGLGLTSFLGMLDLLVGQLFLHQDRFLGLLPTVANILVYFYVINLTRGLVFGDSVSCLLWFLFGLVDIYRKDPSSASLLDLTPYKVIPVHTVGFGLYILMSELVEVMLHSGEPELVQGRYLTYSGGQKNGSGSSRRSNASDTSSNHLRFELCITEITPFTVSFCLNTLSDPLSVQDPEASAASASSASLPSPSPSFSSTPSSPSTVSGSGSRTVAGVTKKKSGAIEGQGNAKTTQSSVGKGSRQQQGQPMPIPGTSRIVSTADIAVHVNFIPWREVLYHYPDQQSFMIYGLTPSTNYEIEMKVYPYSSFVTRVGTRAAPPGMISPFKAPEIPRPVETHSKATKGRKNKKNKKEHEKNVDTTSSHAASTNITSNTHGASSLEPYANASSSPSGHKANNRSSLSTASGSSVSPKSGLLPGSSSLTPENLQRTKVDQETASTRSCLSPLSSFPAAIAASPAILPKDPREEEMERLRASIQASTAAIQTTKASLKKLKRDQAKGEALLRQEIEGLERGQAKAALQDQKRRQKLSFLQESIKQTQAAASLLSEELRGQVASQQEGSGRYHGAQMDAADREMAKVNEAIKAIEHQEKQEIQQWNKENRQLQQEIKAHEAEQQQWRIKADKFHETDLAPLQLRLQRLEQQQVVWGVAAEANRDKQKQQGHRHQGSGSRMHDDTLATLEKELEQLRESIRQTEAMIQTLKAQNMELKKRVDLEVEVWENLEQRGSRIAHRCGHSRSRSTSRSSNGSGTVVNGIGLGGGTGAAAGSSLRANGVDGGGLHSVSPPLTGASTRSYSQAAVVSMSMSNATTAPISSANGGGPAGHTGSSSGSSATARYGLRADLWTSSPFGFVTTLSPTLASPKPKSTNPSSSSSSEQP